jgi:hypothetical protein
VRRSPQAESSSGGTCFFEAPVPCHLGAQPCVVVVDFANLVQNRLPHRGIRGFEAMTCLPQDGAGDGGLATEMGYRAWYRLS